jgi:hypothetical protein
VRIRHRRRSRSGENISAEKSRALEQGRGRNSFQRMETRAERTTRKRAKYQTRKATAKERRRRARLALLAACIQAIADSRPPPIY